MKRITVISLLSAFSLLFIASCFDAKDFDLDKLSTSDVKTTLSVPLFKDSLWLDPSSTLGKNIKYVGDTAAFYFEVPTIELPGITDMLNVPPVSMPLPGGTYLEDFSGGPWSGGDISLPTIMVPIDMSATEQPDAVLDAIVVDGLQMVITNGCSFDATFTVDIPEFEDDGSSTLTVNVAKGSSAPLTLNGRLGLENNEFAVEVTVQGPGVLSAGPISYGGNLSFDVMPALKEVYGYFGQTTIAPEPTTVDNIEAIDRITGDYAIKEAYLDIVAINYTGIPVQLKLDKVFVGTEEAENVDQFLVDAASSLATGKSKKYRLGGEVLGPVINKIIKGEASSAGFEFSVLTNPAGTATTPANFMTMSGDAFSVSGEVIVPLHLTATNLTVRDTLDLGIDYEFDGLSANVHYVNNMPVGVKLQGELLNDNDVSIASLFETPVEIKAPADIVNGRVVKPAVATSPGVLTDDAVSKMKDARRIAIALTVETAGTEHVLITKSNYVKVQVGVQATVKLDDIDDDL